MAASSKLGGGMRSSWPGVTRLAFDRPLISAILRALVDQRFARPATFWRRAFDEPTARGWTFGLKPNGTAVGGKHTFLKMFGGNRQYAAVERGNQSFVKTKLGLR